MGALLTCSGKRLSSTALSARTSTKPINTSDQTMTDRSTLPWLTFDCYDTLVTYSESKAECLAELIRARGGDGDTIDTAQAAFETREREIQTGPFKLLNAVLRESLNAAMATAGLDCTADDETALIDAVCTAPPFNDVPKAMRALRENFRLAILSNSEPDIIRHSIIRIGIGMDAIVLAADAKCYKPAPDMFRALLKRIKTPADQVTHVAQSFYHDIRPSKDAGFGGRIWINRYAREGDAAYAPDYELADLSGVAAILASDN